MYDIGLSLEENLFFIDVAKVVRDHPEMQGTFGLWRISSVLPTEDAHLSLSFDGEQQQISGAVIPAQDTLDNARPVFWRWEKDLRPGAVGWVRKVT